MLEKHSLSWLAGDCCNILCTFYNSSVSLSLPHLTSFFSPLQAVGSDGKTESKLVLSGSNVLEGLRECIASGLVTLPLPHTLADMHQRLQTTITFTPQDP